MSDAKNQNKKCNSCGVELVSDIPIKINMCKRCLKYKDNDDYFISLLLKLTERDVVKEFFYEDAEATLKKCHEEMLEMPYWHEQQKLGRKLKSAEEIIEIFNSPVAYRLPAFD